MTTTENTMELGDIIKIISPNNLVLHNNIFFIYYLDDSSMTIISHTDFKEYKLNIENEELLDENIENVKILHKNPQKGFARQNDLVVGKQISVEFGGHVPFIINGEITNLEEDMIELKTYKDDRVIYIDFGYMGIPKNLPIVSIKEFILPEGTVEDKIPEEYTESDTNEVELPDKLFDEHDLELYDDDDLKLLVNEEFLKIMKNNKDLIIEADAVFGSNLEAIDVEEEYEVKGERKRFDLDVQTNDILNELLSVIPSDQQIPKVMERIHQQIKRYIELRDEFSVKNSQNNIIRSKIFGKNNKPLKHNLKTMGFNLKWIIPIVTNIKKIYSLDIYEGDTNNDLVINTLDLGLYDDYMNNQISDDENKTYHIINKIQEYLKPIEEPENKVNILHELPINNNIETIVHNNINIGDVGDGDNVCVSSTVYKDSIYLKQNNIQQYITGTKMYEFNYDTKNKEIIQISENESIPITGFLTLPTKLRHVYDITSNNYDNDILTTSQLHQNRVTYSHWNILNNVANIQTLELNEDFINNNNNNKNKNNNNNNIKNELQVNDKYFKQFLFAEKINYHDRNTAKTYDKFLHSLIPSVRYLIAKNIKNNNALTIDKMIKSLGHFNIRYNELYKDEYNEMVLKIENNVLLFNKNINERNNKSQRFVRANKNWKIKKNILFTLLNIKHKDIYELYNINEHELFSESLEKIINLDNGLLWNTALNNSILDLYQDIDIEQVVERELEEAKVNIEVDREGDKDCSPFHLAKKYIELDELKADDGIEDIYFDKKYDTTPYDIKSEFGEFESLPIEEFIAIIKNHLIDKMAIDPKIAIRDATAVVNGFRKVQEGDYATLEKDEKTTFYIRINNKWRIDNDMSKKDLEGISFCNTRAKCLNINDTCDNIHTNRNKMKQELLKNILDNFENSYTVNMKEYKEQNKELLNFYKRNIALLQKLNKSRAYFYNDKKVHIAKQLVAREIKLSPHVILRDLILGEDDFVKKQNYIMFFAEKFCVNPDLTDEQQSQFWLYCKDTGLPLLPTFLSTLANAFEDNMYSEKLTEISLKQGEESDDGDKIVDKYSGYTIRHIDFDLNEGYDEMGFKISTNAEIDSDFLTKRDIDIIDEAGDLNTEKAKELAKVNRYENKDAVMIANVIITLNTQLNIKVDAEDFVINNVLFGLENDLLDQKTYSNQVLVAKKKNRKIRPYDDIHDEYLLLLTIAYYIIKVQTLIPSVSTHRTFPGCNPKSFTGYPLDGDDLTFLKYIMCVIASIRINTTDRPWTIIPKSKSKRSEIVNKYSLKVKDYIENKVLIRSTVQELLGEKRSYLKTNSEIVISEEFDIKSWNTFLPPLNAFKINGLTSVDASFFSRLKSNIAEGNFKQHGMYYAILGKIIKNSLYIQELINNVVKKEKLILSTVGNVIILNVCCNQGQKYTLQYFIDKDPNISKYNDIVNRLSIEKYKYKTNDMSFINDSVNRKIVYSTVQDGYDENLIYQNFIKHCSFNEDINIGEGRKLICGKNHAGFTKFQTLAEKIDIMKKENLNYTQTNLIQLLNLINKLNIVDIDLTLSKFEPDQTFKSIISLLLNKKTHNHYSHDLLNTIRASLLDQPNQNELSNADLLQMELYKDIESLKNNIIDKMTVIGFKKKAKSHLNDLLTWENITFDITMSNSDRTNFIASDFLKQNLLFFIDFLPLMIINNVEYGSKKKIPAHWNLSPFHEKDINTFIFKEFSSFTEFYNDDLLNKCMLSVLKNGKEIKDFITNIPFYCQYLNTKNDSVIERKIHSTIIKLLFFHSLLLIFNLYINSLHFIDSSLLNDLNKRETDIKLRKLVEQSITLIHNRKSIIDMNQDSLGKNVSTVKEKEKEDIKERLGKLSKEARKIEDVMKNLSLGDWALGRSSAVYIYDAQQYDKERKQIEDNAIRELRTGGMDDVSNLHSEIFTIDDSETRHNARIIEQEVNTITMIDDDDPGEHFDGDELF
jgi:hypothetical protein